MPASIVGTCSKRLRASFSRWLPIRTPISLPLLEFISLLTSVHRQNSSCFLFSSKRTRPPRTITVFKSTVVLRGFLPPPLLFQLAPSQLQLTQRSAPEKWRRRTWTRNKRQKTCLTSLMMLLISQIGSASFRMLSRTWRLNITHCRRSVQNIRRDGIDTSLWASRSL